MNDEEGDLWSDEINVDALSPAMMLNQQSEALSRRTQGLVRGDLSAQDDTASGFTILHLDIVAPAVPHRSRILAARFNRASVYPAVITPHDNVGFVGGVSRPGKGWGLLEEEAKRSCLAYSPSEFEQYLGQVLRSWSVKSTIVSLIAKSNEVRQGISIRGYSAQPVNVPGPNDASELTVPDEFAAPANERIGTDDERTTS